MRKILKYLIGLLFCTSLLVTLIPFMEVQETDICLMDLFRAMATGNYTSASEYVLEPIQEFLAGPFIMAMAILITILLCAVYMFVSGWKSSYIIALSGAVIVNGEVALLAWRLYTDVYIAIKDSATLSLLFDSINIKILPLYVWCIQHFGLAFAVNLKQLPFFLFVKFHVNFLLLKMSAKKERPSDQMKRSLASSITQVIFMWVGVDSESLQYLH